MKVSSQPLEYFLQSIVLLIAIRLLDRFLSGSWLTQPIAAQGELKRRFPLDPGIEQTVNQRSPKNQI